MEKVKNMNQTNRQRKKGLISIIVLSLVLFFSIPDRPRAQMMHGFEWNSNYRSPGIAAALSLQPMPLDLGNFYVENWRRAILYSTVESAIFIPAMILVMDHSDWNHGWNNNDIDNSREWTSSERETFYGLLGGYVLVKLVSAFDAGNQAEKFNQRISLSLNTVNDNPGVELALYLRKNPKKRR